MPILTKDQEEIRRLVNTLIQQLISLARINLSMTPQMLRETHRQSSGRLPRQKMTITKTTFRRIFGFDDKNAPGHLTTMGIYARPIRPRHLGCIAKALAFLELYRNHYSLGSENYAIWKLFLEDAISAVEKAARDLVYPQQVAPAPDIWKQITAFSSEEAIAILSSRRCEEGIKTRSKLHIQANRDRLIAEVLDAFVRNPNSETYNSVLLVIGYHRLYHPEVDDPRLWDEPKALVRKKLAERYSAIADKEIGFRSLISADDKRSAYDAFFEIGARLKKHGDVVGFAEAAKKMSIVRILEGEFESARRILLDAQREYNKGKRIKSEFQMFYADHISVQGKLDSALCRVEIALGNPVAALGYINEADRFARMTGDFYSLGNVYEDRAVLAMNDHNQNLAETYIANAATCYEAFGDMRRANVSRLLLTPAGNWNGKLIRASEQAAVG